MKNSYISFEKCRERRRKRIEMRRMSTNTVNALSQRLTLGARLNSELKICRKKIAQLDINPAPLSHFSSSLASSSKRRLQYSQDMIPIHSQEIPMLDPPPPVVGLMSVAGKASYMEDTVSIFTDLCRPKINHSRPLHFFGLYDGHGGVHVSALCRDWMHVLMEEELMRAGNPICCYNVFGLKGREREEELEKRLWTSAIKKCFQRMDEMALSSCPCGAAANQCRAHTMQASLSGSTAVAAMLTRELIVVANCGDSRAVLCRAGNCVPLTSDHKPDRADEYARIRASGGRVINLNGSRVEGILAMSRAIGDKYLKPIVTSEPEICFMKRDMRDECLIIASDGLWDVVSNKLACEVASNCLRNGGGPNVGLDVNYGAAPHNSMMASNDGGMGFNFASTSELAAAILSRLALGRHSADNISVVVVDLRRRPYY